MRYQITTNRGRTPATVITHDGVVVWATPSFEWAVSVRLEVHHLLGWLDRKGIQHHCIGAEYEPTPAQLVKQERRMNPANYVDYSVRP